MRSFPTFQTLIMLVFLAILLWLGGWQVERLHWKQGIIVRLNAAYDAGDSTVTAKRLQADSAQDMPLDYGTVEGRLVREKSVLVGPSSDQGRVGYNLLIPLLMADGRALIVNAGWVAEQWKDNLPDHLVTIPGGAVKLRGLIRKPDWSRFASNNSPVNDLWFRPDPAEIGRAKKLDRVYPVILYAEDGPLAQSGVVPHEGRWLPRKAHRQYAIFWFSMAGVLLVIYAAYVRSYRKKRTPDALPPTE